jgi:hypothetical protein
LNCLILIIKNWFDDAYLGCERAKEKKLDHFFTCEGTLNDEHKKFIAEQGFFKEDLDFRLLLVVSKVFVGR